MSGLRSRKHAVAGRSQGVRQSHRATSLFPPMYRGANPMTEALYWREEAAKIKQVAEVAEDRVQQAELLELAQACEAVAVSVEHRAATT